MAPAGLGSDQDMTPPETPTAPPAVSLCLKTLQNRPDFLRAASARRQGTGGFLLQARRRQPDELAEAPVRIGYTCSKKIGNAVTRNRAKRRLRALVRAVMPGLAQPGWDYVLVGRPQETVSRDFKDLQGDLANAMARVHAPKARK